MASKFTQTEVCFKDTRGAGGVCVRGIELKTDEEGFIEGPANLEAELAPHGFVRMDRPNSKTMSLPKGRI